MKEDMMRLHYVIYNKAHTEYFIYPFNKKPSHTNRDPEIRRRQEAQKQASQDPNRLNILYFMIDSISRASAQRYLNATYKALKKDPNSVILKVYLIMKKLHLSKNTK